MHRIHPICEETIRPHYGRLVCAVMHDGTEYYGIVSRMEGGKLILNDYPDTASTLSKKKKQVKTKSSRHKPMKVSYLGFGYPYGYGFGYGYPFGFGRRLALDLAAIALLFALVV